MSDSRTACAKNATGVHARDGDQGTRMSLGAGRRMEEELMVDAVEA